MTPTITIGLLGDSVTRVSYFDGVPDSRWDALLQAELRTASPLTTVTNYGENGRVTNDYLVGGSHPPSVWTGEEYYILCFGYNEPGATPAQFRSYTEALIAAVQGEGGTPILMTQYGVLYPLLSTVERTEAWIEPYNDEYRAIADETGIGLIDLFADTIDFVNAAGDMRIRNWSMVGGSITDPNMWGPSTLDEDGFGGPTIDPMWRGDIHPNITGNQLIAESATRYVSEAILAAIVWSDVTDLAPDLTAVSANAQTLILSWVNNEALNADQFGGDTASEYKLARIYLAAHFGQLSSSLVNNTGAVQSEQIGDLRRSFQMHTTNNPELLASTRWGQMYLSLVRRSYARLPRVV